MKIIEGPSHKTGKMRQHLALPGAAISALGVFFAATIGLYPSKAEHATPTSLESAETDDITIHDASAKILRPRDIEFTGPNTIRERRFEYIFEYHFNPTDNTLSRGNVDVSYPVPDAFCRDAGVEIAEGKHCVSRRRLDFNESFGSEFDPLSALRHFCGQPHGRQSQQERTFREIHCPKVA